MSNIPASLRIKCHAIIHAATLAAAAVGAGLAQFPGSDSAVIIPIQTGMTVALGRVFGITLGTSAAEAAIATAGATCAGRFVSQVAVGWIPGFGNTVNATTAAGITEAIGWILAEEFAQQALGYQET